MSQTKTITVNRLPSKTWNRLKLNSAAVSVPQSVQGADIAFAPMGALTVQNGAENWNDVETGLGKELDSYLSNTPCALVSLDAAQKMESPALLTCTFAPGGAQGQRVLVHAGAGSALSLAVLCRSTAPGEGTAALQIKVRAEEGASVQLYLLETLDDNVTALIDTGAQCERNAKVELTRLELGAKNLYAGGLAALDGVGSRFTAHLGYFARSGQRMDMNYLARHRGKQTSCLMDCSGVLSGDAFKLFRGSIDFLPGCAGAKGEEKEDILLLGEDVINQTIPLILCGEEDVEGNHGATIGRLDEKMLFYLASRGISESDARRLLARARVEALAQQMPQVLADEARRFMEEHQNEL